MHVCVVAFFVGQGRKEGVLTVLLLLVRSSDCVDATTIDVQIEYLLQRVEFNFGCGGLPSKKLLLKSLW